MYDIFISHASEDKESIVKSLAHQLADIGLKVWYDEFSLRLGDSLLQSIQHGIANSRYGVVVFSPNFFCKNWPKAELDGLFAKEIGGDKVILPVWHEIGYEEVVKHSPNGAGCRAYCFKVWQSRRLRECFTPPAETHLLQKPI